MFADFFSDSNTFIGRVNKLKREISKNSSHPFNLCAVQLLINRKGMEL